MNIIRLSGESSDIFEKLPQNKKELEKDIVLKK